jgi:cytochrome b involved in lipid metabolism
MEEVAKHSTAGDCWSVINGIVYGLSTWIPKHPGGSGSITAMCGGDGSGSYNGKHGGSGGAGNILSKLRLGTVTAAKPKPVVNYTLKDVSLHSSETDCWSAVGDSVYDITAWVGKHPGGRDVIIAMCGIDGTATFNSQHAKSDSAKGALSSYKIGLLVPDTTPKPAEIMYTLADVSKHSTAADCWSAVNKGVYNLTVWIPKHPGGKSVIVAMCGKDGSSSFNGMHGHSESANAALVAYRIGSLSITNTSAKIITLTKVKAHGAAKDCWTVVNGKVYNLTPYTKKNPGNKEFINAVCGKNGTKAVKAKFGSPAKVTKFLSKYQIGRVPVKASAKPASVPSKNYTLKQVTEHNKVGNCWSAVGANVYNLTTWIPLHPGGKSVIVSMCGTNGTAAYNSQHKGDITAAKALKPYKIGTLTK